MSDREMERALAADAAKLEALGQDSGRVPASPPATGKEESRCRTPMGCEDRPFPCPNCLPASPRESPLAGADGWPGASWVDPVASGTPKHDYLVGVLEGDDRESPAPAAPGVDEDEGRTIARDDRQAVERIATLCARAGFDNPDGTAVGAVERVLERVAPLLALVESWQEARRDYAAGLSVRGQFVHEGPGLRERVESAEAALAAWRNK